MKNAKRKIIVSVAAVAALYSAFSAGIMAQTTLEKIQAYKDNAISFKVNGKAWVPQDAVGKKLSPIRYNDTLYLPAAAIGKATGYAVKYDNKTQTVELTGSVSTNSASSASSGASTAGSPQAAAASVDYTNTSKLTLEMFTENYNQAKEANSPVIAKDSFVLGNYPKSNAKIYDYKYTPTNSSTSLIFSVFMDPGTGEVAQINPSIEGTYSKEIMRSLLSGMLGGPAKADEFIQANSFYSEINRTDAATPKQFTYKTYKIQHYRTSGDSAADILSIYTTAPGQR